MMNALDRLFHSNPIINRFESLSTGSRSMGGQEMPIPTNFTSCMSLVDR